MSDSKLSLENMDNDNWNENTYSVDEELVSKEEEIKGNFYTNLDDLSYSIMHTCQLFSDIEKEINEFNYNTEKLYDITIKCECIKKKLKELSLEIMYFKTIK